MKELNKETINEIVKIMMIDEYAIYGIRGLSSDEKYEIGDECRNSYDWNYECDHSTYEDEEPVELPGTCSVRIHIRHSFNDDEKEVVKAVENAWNLASKYSDINEYVLIAGDQYEWGIDMDEVIIRRAYVLYNFTVYILS